MNFDGYIGDMFSFPALNSSLIRAVNGALDVVDGISNFTAGVTVGVGASVATAGLGTGLATTLGTALCGIGSYQVGTGLEQFASALAQGSLSKSVEQEMVKNICRKTVHDVGSEVVNTGFGRLRGTESNPVRFGKYDLINFIINYAYSKYQYNSVKYPDFIGVPQNAKMY